MKKEIRTKRKELLIKSKNLQSVSFEKSTYEKSRAIKDEQDKIYKKWLFYDKFIKATEKESAKYKK
jgi:hypothetical protein